MGFSLHFKSLDVGFCLALSRSQFLMRLRIPGLLLVILLPMNLFAQDATPPQLATPPRRRRQPQSCADANPRADPDTDRRADTPPAAATASGAGQRIAVWSVALVSGRTEGRGSSY